MTIQLHAFEKTRCGGRGRTELQAQAPTLRRVLVGGDTSLERADVYSAVDAETMPGTAIATCFAYSPSLDRWVALASEAGVGDYAWSSDDDGATWTSRTAPFAATGFQYTDCTWDAGAGVFVACNGTAAEIASSSDGITWNLRTSAFTAAGSTFTQGVGTNGNGLLVIVGQDVGNRAIQTSTDGTTWTLRTYPGGPVAGALFRVVYGNGIWCAFGQDTAYVTSTNGTTWTARTFTAAGYLAVSGCCFSPWLGKFVIISVTALAGGTTTAFTSEDGITWTEASYNEWDTTAVDLISENHPQSLTHDGAGHLICVGDHSGSPRTWISRDGDRWVAGPVDPLNKIAIKGKG